MSASINHCSCFVNSDRLKTLSKSTLKPFRMSHSLTMATDSVLRRTLQFPQTYARIPLDQKKNPVQISHSPGTVHGQMPVGDVDKPNRGAINEQWLFDLFLYRKLPRSMVSSRCDTLVRQLKSNTGNVHVTNSSGTKKMYILL